jgi:hypothetical protein
MRFLETRINTEEANCRDLDTNIFFDVEEKRNSVKMQEDFDSKTRPICGSCPVWEECLNWAYNNKEVGVWGGLTTVERQSLKARNMGSIRKRALKALLVFGITEDYVLDVIRKDYFGKDN